MRRPRLPDGPGHRRPGHGRARHRRGARAGPVAADGPDKKKGETYLNYVVPRVRRRQRLPGRLDVQGVRARRGDPAGHPADHPDRGAADDVPPAEPVPHLRRQLTSTEVWSPENSTGSGTYDLYTGTQQSVNTFFAQLEQRTGLCEPVKLARSMGVDVPERQTVVPPFTLGVDQHRPADDGRGLRHLRRPRHCARRRSGRPRSSTARQAAPGATRESASRCSPATSPTRSTTSSAASRSRTGFGYLADLALAPVRRQDRHDQREHGRVVPRLHPRAGRRLDDRGGQPAGQGSHLNGQTIGGTYVEEAFGCTNAGPMWGDMMKVVQRWLPDTNFRARTRRTIEGQLVTVPSSTAGAGRGAKISGAAGLFPQDRSAGRLRGRRRHRGLHRPGLRRGRHRQTVTDLHSDGSRCRRPREPEPRRRRSRSPGPAPAAVPATVAATGTVADRRR